MHILNRRYSRLIGAAWLLVLAAMAAGCAQDASPAAEIGSTATPKPELPALPSRLVAVSVEQQDLADPSTSCEGTFVAHDLDHTITIASDVVNQYVANGAGLGINDLDNDGDLDIVLANLDGPNAILWNGGSLTFRKEELPHGDSRGVSIVDVDGDGWQDVAFSRRGRVPLDLWRNNGVADPPGFTHDDEFGVRFGYSKTWGDLDEDGDLDLVVADYEIELATGEDPDEAVGGGVIYYENQDGRFAPTLLSYEAQTLATLLIDLNGDGHLDIMAGNDFELQDQTWYWQKDGWEEARPFAATAHSTMSFDAGDIDNDGDLDIFSTDMMPYAHDYKTAAAWQPMMDMMHDMPMMENDPQIMANVLQIRGERGLYENRADCNGVATTGWAWSSKFGDLDNDGFLDLYSVNGMVAVELFHHLPNDELIEENQAFRNGGNGRFAPAPAWGLNSTRGGRGMSMADMDGDGDLDVVVNNLLAQAQLFENRLCGGSGLEVDLLWPQSRNTRAIGAELTLYTTTGTYRRDVRAVSGYQSGDPARVHFGFINDSELMRLDIRWPDGKASSVDSPAPRTLLAITRR